jgi:hypothetical protein
MPNFKVKGEMKKVLSESSSLLQFHGGFPASSNRKTIG